jgi:hypothetical protein
VNNLIQQALKVQLLTTNKFWKLLLVLGAVQTAFVMEAAVIVSFGLQY